MSTTAVISDIHANAAALHAVLADIESRAVKRVICLGDIVGYGPDPLECVDVVSQRCEWALLGNHDFAALYEPTNFNPAAANAAYWTRDQFEAEPDPALRASRLSYLARLRVRVVDKPNGSTIPVLAIHGSPRRPINEYIFPDDVMTSPDKIRAIFDRVDRIAVCGHTHVPGVFTDEPDFYTPDELGSNTYTLMDDEKAIINVGSVGQPRDHDPRAAYVLLHAEDDELRVEFVRVPYDIARTAEKIRAIDALSDWLGDRLFEGR